MATRTEGFDELARKLARQLAPYMAPVGLALGELMRDRMAPYPAQRPPRNPNRWYERGYGPRWRTRAGSVKGRKTSETLGRRWDVQPRGLGAEVRNLASYSGYVHGAAMQTQVHADTGWVTDEAAANSVMNDGSAATLLEGTIRRALGDLVEG